MGRGQTHKQTHKQTDSVTTRPTWPRGPSWLVSGLFNEGSSDELLRLDAMANSGVNKLARETGLTAAQQEVKKGLVNGELRVQTWCSQGCSTNIFVIN